jgi:hypothetical protein
MEQPIRGQQPEDVTESRVRVSLETFLHAYADGMVLDVLGRRMFRPHGLPHRCISYEEYLEHVVRSDTTILHLLLGSGVEDFLFRRIFYRSRKLSKRSIIVELNAEAKDRIPAWKDFCGVHAEWLIKFIPSYQMLEFRGGARFDDSLVIMVVDS